MRSCKKIEAKREPETKEVTPFKFDKNRQAKLKEKELANMLEEEMKNMGINKRKL